MEICTIGFTKHSAREFFGILRAESVERLIDVRLNNVSQLAGIAKRDDLLYFLELHGIGYTHEPRLLAPTADLLKAYRNREITWDDYENRFLDLMDRRARFEYGGVEYDLPMTFEFELPRLGEQAHHSNSSWYFTISLGEPWEEQGGDCFKLVACALEAPS